MNRAPVTYLFGVTDAEPERATLGAARRPPGSGPVRSLEASGLVAIVCALDPQVVTTLQAATPDAFDTIAEVALAHDEVLAAVSRERTVLPLRLGTVVADDEAARLMLSRHEDRLRDELERVAGHGEWAITVRLAAPTGTPPAGSSADPEGAASGGGRGYMERRRAELDAREQRRDTRTNAARRVHERLRTHATESVTTDEAGTLDVPAMRAFYLVASAHSEVFLAEVDTLRAEHPGVLVEATGPLPPYHFVAPNITVAGMAAS